MTFLTSYSKLEAETGGTKTSWVSRAVFFHCLLRLPWLPISKNSWLFTHWHPITSQLLITRWLWGLFWTHSMLILIAVVFPLHPCSSTGYKTTGYNKTICAQEGLPGASDGKESACNAGDRVWILGQEDPPEKEMATHSSILAWRIPWTEEPSGLKSVGSQRVRHDWA